MEAYWTPLARTAGFRPVLINNEVEFSLCKDVSVYFGDRSVHTNGSMTVTSHRLFWVEQGQQISKKALVMHLKHIRDLETKAGFFGFSSPKIIMYLHALPVIKSTTALINTSSSPLLPPSPGYMRLSFHQSGRDTFMDKMKEALKMKVWRAEEEEEMKKQRKERFSTKSAGINGILRKSKKTQQAENKALSEAFSDLDALMKNAMQIVRLSTRIQASMEEKMKNMSDSQDKANSDFDSHDKNTNNDRSRGRNNADTHRKGGGDRKRQCEKLAKENDEFNQMLHFMGIPSPVTRDTAGSQYHIELSRQLADFLHEPLENQFGGMMPLTDIYCLFNRARGTELISPDDLLLACQNFQTFDLPMRLRRFKSTGVLVVQALTSSDASITARIIESIDNNGPTTWMELSQTLSLSITLAKQYLMQAERAGKLCRDESEEGVRFHINRFPTFN